MAVQPAAVELLAAAAPVLTRWGRWYVFGAQAVVVHGVPRLSADVDVTLAPTPDAPVERTLWLLEEALAQGDLVASFDAIARARRPE